ncbi:MAG: asparaginase [Polyangiaceae bacterium]
MPKVLVLHTGGTLMMQAGAGASRAGAPLTPDVYGRDLAAELPSLVRIADLETRILFTMDSGDMRPEDWIAIAREVHAAAADPGIDGIVIVHGTDTMAYTASALGLLLGPLPKPVVLTGAQRPLALARTDARENLIDAVLVATLPVPEVTIAFASRALRGARATKRDAWAFDAFDSPNCAPLVELGLGVDVAKHVRERGALRPFDARLDPRVLAVRVFPGIDPSLLRGAVRAGVRGLVLEAYGTGNLPHLGGSLIPALEEAREMGVPVLVVSQCLRGFVDMSAYAGGAQAKEAGAISGGDMTVEAAIAKLMIGLARYEEPAALRAWLEDDVCGERAAYQE